MVYCSVHILKFLHGVCFEKGLCSFEAKGQEFVTFSRHCCCSREITIIWMHFIMLCIFRALFCHNANLQKYYSLHGHKFFKETTQKIMPAGTEQQKASRIQLGPLSVQQDRAANHFFVLLWSVLYKAFITLRVDYCELEGGSTT